MILHVICVPDGAAWFGQGIELDYAAAGKDLAEMQDHFMRGLKATIRIHLEKLGFVDKRPLSTMEREEYGVFADGSLVGDILEKQGGHIWTTEIEIPPEM